MLCQACEKNPATLHYTKVVNGEVTELHLCEECAKDHKELEFDTPFSFHKFLTGLIDNIQDSPTQKEEDLVCKTCGMSYEKFKQVGKFSCPNCYDAFKDRLIPLFKEVHGHNSHIGKIPKRGGGIIGIKRELKVLKSQLDSLVKKEEFEKAAIVRDKIKELEGEIEGGRK
ncbi:MAG TPA: UvrB/UvrC motif-containing protein [Tissierellales bacterium]|nr:UvrB/UvrC motif-containing protein [Tissierellales bacterium]